MVSTVYMGDVLLRLWYTLYKVDSLIYHIGYLYNDIGLLLVLMVCIILYVL